MRILMINHHRRYRSLHRSGAFAVELAKGGHEVTLMLVADTERWRVRESRLGLVRVIESPDLAAGRLRSGWDPVCALRRMRLLAHMRGRFDLVHLFETRPATIVPGLWYARREGLPLAIDWNDWWGRGGLIAVNRPLWYRWLFGAIETYFEEHFRTCADATTVISRGLAARAAALGVPPESITVLPPGIDAARFAVSADPTLRQQLGFGASDVILGYSSQDTFFDLDPVLEGVRRAREQGCPLRLLALGQPTRAFLRRIARRGFEGLVHLTGFVSDADYPRYLALADYAVVPFAASPANLGRWPNKFGDYLAAGLPIVFNPFGELEPFAADPPGIACECRAEAFAAAFLALWRDSALRGRLAARAREIAATKFRWSERIRILEGAYAYATRARDRRSRISRIAPV
jgi:glycosyltransferase involved in cell wall biosynthesis